MNFVKLLFVIISTCFLLTNISFAGKYHSAIKYIHPLPNSRVLPQGTTIILKLEDEYLNSITNLDSLIQIDGFDGSSFWSTDEKTIIFKPDQLFPLADTIVVKIQASQFLLEDYEFKFSIRNSVRNVIPDLDSTDIFAKINNNFSLSAPTPPRIANGVVLPNDFPNYTTKIYGETAPGYITFKQGQYLIMCDNNGAPYFYRKMTDPKVVGNNLVHYTDDHPEGVMTSHMGGYTDGSVYFMFNNNFEVIDTIEAGHGYITDNHECQVLPNGHILIIGRENDVKVDMSLKVEGGVTNARIQANCFQELDLDRNVIFEWRSWDYLEITDVVFSEAADTRVDVLGDYIDAVHMNSVEIDYDGNYLISTKTLCQLTKIDRETGEIIWVFGGNPKTNQFTFINDDSPIGYQHDIRPVLGKPNEYTLFDNGNNRYPDLYSRGVHVKLDTENMTAEKIWEFRYSPDRFTQIKGATQVLENGNYYIDWTHQNIFGSEITPQGEVVFEISGDGGTYRTRRYNWNAFKKSPELFLENYENVLRLIYNKFGDKNVASYNIYYGLDYNPTDLLTSTNVAYYDLDISTLLSSREYYFRVTAVDSQGVESEYSNEESIRTPFKPIEPGENMVFNGDFETGFAPWNWRVDQNANAFYEIDQQGQLHFNISEGGNEYYNVQANYEGLPLNLFKKYRFEFDAYADGNRVIEAEVRKASTPFTYYSQIGLTNITREKQHFTYDFVMNAASDNEARIVFNVGNSNIDVYIDNVELKQVIATDINEKNQDIPLTYSLNQNYPNPFNPSTTIKFGIPEISNVQISVFNVIGEKIKVILNDSYSAGIHEFSLDMSKLPSGIYFYRIQASAIQSNQTFSEVKKMSYLK